MLIRIGTRKSKLALAQVDIVIKQLLEIDKTLEFEIVKITTSGDKFYDKNLAMIGGKGLFLKEIEEALLSNDVDIAVHSMKDVPAEIPNGLTIDCVLEREDPRDVFVSYKYKSLCELPAGSIVGTSSQRRAVLCKEINPLIKIVPFRGNIITRLEKIKNGEVDASIFALAGFKRINLEEHIKEIFDPTIFVPAVGQGAIGIERRSSDTFLKDLLSKINHKQTFDDVSIEREFLREHGGNCTDPIGAYKIGDMFYSMRLDANKKLVRH